MELLFADGIAAPTLEDLTNALTTSASDSAAVTSSFQSIAMKTNISACLGFEHLNEVIVDVRAWW